MMQFWFCIATLHQQLEIKFMSSVTFAAMNPHIVFVLEQFSTHWTLFGSSCSMS